MLTKAAFIWLNSKCSNIVKFYYILKELIYIHVYFKMELILVMNFQHFQSISSL